MNFKNIVFAVVMCAGLSQVANAQVSNSQVCGGRTASDDADVYTTGYGGDNGVSVRTGFIYNGCKIISANMIISENNNSLLTVSSPIDAELQVTALGNKKVVHSVAAKNDCTSPFESKLRVAALAKLSTMGDQVTLSSTDLPLCSEATLSTGLGVIAYRGFYTTQHGYVDALFTGIIFNKSTGEIVDQFDSASGM